MLLYRSLCRSWFMVYRDVSRWLLWGYLKGIVVFCEDCVCLLQCVCFCINDSASPQTISPMKSHELKLNLSDLVKKKTLCWPRWSRTDGADLFYSCTSAHEKPAGRSFLLTGALRGGVKEWALWGRGGAVEGEKKQVVQGRMGRMWDGKTGQEEEETRRVR